MQPAARPLPQAFSRCLRLRRLAAGASLAVLSLMPHGEALAQDTPAGAPAPVPASAPAPSPAPSAPEEIRFEADRLQYANDSDTVTAAGNVVLRREDQTVRADTVTWNRKSGQIEANGNIRFVDDSGNVLYTDKVELTDELKAGAIEDMLLVLREGGRLAAQSGERDEKGNLVLHNAAYSGCAVEDENGCPKKPSWEITAVRVSYDAADKRVKYEGATLHMFGVPLLPLPGLGHTSDFRAETGLLIPDLRLGASNGVEISDTWYWRIADNKDLALTGYVYTGALPMVSARYRQLTDLGAYQITGYLTRSSRILVGSGTTTLTDTSANRFRGYFEANGRFQLSDKWSVTAYGRYASDRTFLRRYDISRDDRLRSSVNLERIDDDSYFSLAGWAIQTLRVGDTQGQVPVALPSLEYRRRIDAPLGKFEIEANSLAITRTSGQDTQRAFARAQWDLRTITGMGQEVTFTGLVRGDVYHSDENALTTNAAYRGNPGWQTRGVATAAVDVKWPLIGSLLGGTQVLTPRVQIVATPHVRNISIPNEDSRSVDLEDSNLFALNRFPGNDRIEDGARVTYGVDWQLTRPGWRVSTTIGQSYRLSKDQTLLPDGTGLATRVSDIVGRTDVRFRDVVQLTHRFRLDKDTLALRRNEFDATIGSHRTYLEVGYLKLNRNIASSFEDLRDREELRAAGRVAFAKYWSAFASAVINLTNKDEDPTNTSDGFQMLRHRIGIAYADDCLDLSFTWRRDYVTTGDASKGNAFQLSLSLRNLGTK
ncbi:LPS assembly protein LptD [Novosphingobium sp. KCTC 2891]|uniref:LPS-assembly protein LptD n=1 Tax=Novosphingobium sp. KCTC 2891 TaxID=2989730 RepID=UPI002222B728|nr:LPS assembly protein LptD [Novosphingobium sp. KCTC 2891]MCW1383994.1 LPS assembly protein LptD [Novosphingobium sp. KCTC 2891]